MKDSIDKYMSFYSVSGDGLVQRWTIVTGILLPTDMFDMPFAKKLENFNHYSELTNLKGITIKIEVIYFPYIYFLIQIDEKLQYDSNIFIRWCSMYCIQAWK